MSDHSVQVFFAILLVIQFSTITELQLDVPLTRHEVEVRVKIAKARMNTDLIAPPLSGCTKAGLNCGDWAQSDHVLYTKDYGVSGIAGPVNLNLLPELQHGAVISVVTKTSTRGHTNLKDEINDFILHVDARISWNRKNELLLATYMNGVWREDYRRLINPIASGAKVTTTIVYEPNGYRIFINGKETAFYDHRNFKVPTVLNLEHDRVYKVMYLTTVKI